MRLIDADALRVHHGVDVGNNFGGLRAVVFKRDIDNAPTIDAVQIVRCRDCKYYWKNNRKYKSNMEDMKDLMMCLASPSDDAFCSEGDRKNYAVD